VDSIASSESEDSGIPCAAPPEKLWSLVARPDRWHEWSPHVRGAEGLGSPEVEAGSKGVVALRGGITLPAEVIEVVPGRSWSWRVGGIVVDHVVRPAASGGSSLEMKVGSTGRAWSLAARAYAPVVGLIARHIVRVAERRGS
jgi:uncharacterized protein YndB with AHSA1/START domain